jgi:geranylgeranyl diphosphate synthase type 3
VTCYVNQNIKCLSLTETGGMFMLATRLVQLFSENKADFTKLIDILGLYIQIRDDYCNLCLQEVTSDLSFLDG